MLGQLWPSVCTHQTTGRSGWQPWYSTQSAGLTATGASVVEQPFLAIQKSRVAMPPVVKSTSGSFEACAIQAPTWPAQVAALGGPPATGAMARSTSPRQQPSRLVK